MAAELDQHIITVQWSHVRVGDDGVAMGARLLVGQSRKVTQQAVTQENLVRPALELNGDGLYSRTSPSMKVTAVPPTRTSVISPPFPTATST